MAASTPFAAGRDADVYALDDRRVLRRYRDGTAVAGEARFMSHLHAAAFPVPRVYLAAGADLVLQRVTGPTMLQALTAGTIEVAAGAGILAELHRRLHAIAPLPGAPDGERILHLDLHPDNVILGPAGPVLLDWRNVRHGPPGLDVAMTALILAQVAVDPDQPMAAGADEMQRAYRYALRDHAAPLVAEAVAIRRANPTQTSTELALLDAAASLLTA
ncbi:phosphotransferase [Verrucosispora sp. WMMA2121]|uniref:phosphotransferase n=1 Tax=Verrucosispora sp. WMMA2121 TaxID=3015164 RepID=UPI0022B70DDB|nr:phosphotransferase [Verrucosispora sp. WMMA2121]MCZ7423041.1 phosphotransferase [Verrucosispora sp. WMMA2121]